VLHGFNLELQFSATQNSSNHQRNHLLPIQEYRFKKIILKLTHFHGNPAFLELKIAAMKSFKQCFQLQTTNNQHYNQQNSNKKIKRHRSINFDLLTFNKVFKWWINKEKIKKKVFNKIYTCQTRAFHLST